MYPLLIVVSYFVFVPSSAILYTTNLLVSYPLGTGIEILTFPFGWIVALLLTRLMSYNSNLLTLEPNACSTSMYDLPSVTLFTINFVSAGTMSVVVSNFMFVVVSVFDIVFVSSCLALFLLNFL